MSKLVEMRGFTFAAGPDWPITGFKDFICVDCKTNVVICGKVVHYEPLRWITRGICRTGECPMSGRQITTRVEYIDPKTLKVV